MKFFVTPVIMSVLAVMAIGISGCQFSTANISDATMALDVDPVTSKPGERTDKYRMWMPTFTCAVNVANAPSDTKVKSVWYVKIDGKDQVMDSTEIVLENSGWCNFTLTRSKSAWAYADYKVDIYLNGKFEKSIPFTVEPTYKDSPVSEIILSTGATETGSPMPPMNKFPSSTDPIYCFVYANNPGVATKYSIIWYQETDEGLYSLATAEVNHDASDWITFSMTQDNPLPAGKYSADILINDEAFGKMEFTIE